MPLDPAHARYDIFKLPPTFPIHVLLSMINPTMCPQGLGESHWRVYQWLTEFHLCLKLLLAIRRSESDVVDNWDNSQTEWYSPLGAFHTVYTSPGIRRTLLLPRRVVIYSRHGDNAVWFDMSDLPDGSYTIRLIKQIIILAEDHIDESLNNTNLVKPITASLFPPISSTLSSSHFIYLLWHAVRKYGRKIVVKL